MPDLPYTDEEIGMLILEYSGHDKNFWLREELVPWTDSEEEYEQRVTDYLNWVMFIVDTKPSLLSYRHELSCTSISLYLSSIPLDLLLEWSDYDYEIIQAVTNSEETRKLG